MTQADQFFILSEEHARLSAKYEQVLNRLSISEELSQNLSIENRILKDEIARLKGTPQQPKLRKNRIEGESSESKSKKKENGTSRGKHPRKNKKGLSFQLTKKLKPENLPAGAKYKDCSKYDVQDIVYTAFNTRYIIERWQLPDGTYTYGKLPENVQGHYGAALKAHVIELAHSGRMSEGLILQQLRERGIAISAGQLSKMLTEGFEGFHEEKEGILKAALESGQIQTDDVGTRHKAKNCYTNVICSDHFVYLSTTASKSRINFLEILARGKNEYRFNEDAIAYLEIHKGAEKLIQALRVRPNLVIETTEPEKAFRKEMGHLNATEIRLMTESGIFGSLIEHGVPRDLHIHSDDAGQFDLFHNSLCWVHEERHYRKMIGSDSKMSAEVEQIREEIWLLYQGLKRYKEDPSEKEHRKLSEAFEKVFKPEKPSKYQVINDRLALTYAKKNRLLCVLDRPETPLHNNSSEIGGRGAKVKCKISGGTRSDKGRNCWDTFGSLNLTCRRLGISFYDFLIDRLLGVNKIEQLGDAIREKTQLSASTNFARSLAISLGVA